MALIELDDLSLTFRVRRQRRVPLKEVVLKRLTGRGGDDPVLEVRTLRNLTLRIGQGERIGIIGHNGAGKSTLLKVLAGVYPPTSGRRTVNGQVSSLFDLTLGFEHHASGRANIFYRGYLLGETPETLKPKVESIVEFSELGTFIDTPVRYYSSGMMVRLGFSIATAIDPEILLIDEVFSAGDRRFQKKASTRLREMMSRAKAIVMVSHDQKLLLELSTRLIWLDRGCVRMEGDPETVAAAYEAYMQSPEASSDPHVGAALNDGTAPDAAAATDASPPLAAAA